MCKTIIITLSNPPHRLMTYIERGGHVANLKIMVTGHHSRSPGWPTVEEEVEKNFTSQWP